MALPVAENLSARVIETELDLLPVVVWPVLGFLVSDRLLLFLFLLSVLVVENVEVDVDVERLVEGPADFALALLPSRRDDDVAAELYRVAAIARRRGMGRDTSSSTVEEPVLRGLWKASRPLLALALPTPADVEFVRLRDRRLMTLLFVAGTPLLGPWRLAWRCWAMRNGFVAGRMCLEECISILAAASSSSSSSSSCSAGAPSESPASSLSLAGSKALGGATRVERVWRMSLIVRLRCRRPRRYGGARFSSSESCSTTLRRRLWLL